MLTHPRVDQPHYGNHLGDTGYWRPYVTEVLSRHGVAVAAIEAPFVGTFPTFLAGNVVVKLFGAVFDGMASYAAELATHRLLSEHPDVPAPRLVYDGCLFDDAPRWPYLVTERLPGAAIKEAGVTGRQALDIARRLGQATAVLHRLPPPLQVQRRDLLPRLRATSPERLARFGFPQHLVDQVPAYLADGPSGDTLVHADITADHVFVAGGELVGIIDWGDTCVADPYYELVAVYLDALRGQRALLDAYLEGYAWTPSEQFTRRAMQAVLAFQFNAVSRVAELVNLQSVRSLDDLAERLFG